MPIIKKCEFCSKEFSVIPARESVAKYCSRPCMHEAMRQRSPEQHPRWKGGERSKTCQHCNTVFEWNGQPYQTWEKQKFCSKQCADKGGLRYHGEDHPNWKEETRRKQRRGKHGSWSRAVISRDNATCQMCGATEQLQAHHICSYADYPDKRWDVSNGLTVCFSCHLKIHSAANENWVNSGEVLPATGTAGDNPEPSSQRKLIEGVTTRGRAYRRWNGNCEWCGCFISKAWSDVQGKKHLFCSKRCSGKFIAAHREWRKWKTPEQPTAVISSKSARPERDDIV